MCTNIYHLFDAFILLRCAPWFLFSFHTVRHFSSSFFLDINQNKNEQKKSKIALIYDCIGLCVLLWFHLIWFRIECETSKTNIYVICCGFAFMFSIKVSRHHTHISISFSFFSLSLSSRSILENEEDFFFRFQ